MRYRGLPAALLLVVACSRTAMEPSSGVGAVGGRSTASPSSGAAASTPAPHPGPEAPPARFVSSIGRLQGTLRTDVVGRNWHPGCPVGPNDLRVVTVAYWGFDRSVHEGPLVVNKAVAVDVRRVFARLYRARFPIKHIALPRKYHPDVNRRNDLRDTTAAFNCRPVTDDPARLSQHAYGWAIDINPVQNPYVRANGTVLRGAAEPFRDRSRHRRGMIHADGVVVRAFDRIGWGWGGSWSTVKDYMHFSLTGT
jgi:hypothetical protein